MLYTPASKANVCKPISSLLHFVQHWQQVYHVQNIDLSVLKRQRYKGFLECFGLNQKLYTSLHVQVHVGQGAPAEARAAALPAGINCQTSPDGTQV